MSSFHHILVEERARHLSFSPAGWQEVLELLLEVHLITPPRPTITSCRCTFRLVNHEGNSRSQAACEPSPPAQLVLFLIRLLSPAHPDVWSSALAGLQVSSFLGRQDVEGSILREAGTWPTASASGEPIMQIVIPATAGEE